MNILILIVNILHAYVWYVLLLMLFCREYVYLTRMFSSKYLSCIYCILYYCPHLLDKTSSKLHCVLTMKFRFKMIDPIFTTCYSKYMTRFGKPSIDHVVLLPVTSTYTNVDKASNTYCSTNIKGAELSKHRETEIDGILNVDSFTTYDQSALNKIDPDINYLTAQTGINDTQYYTEHSFSKLFGKTTNLSLFHLNIRSIPDHFLEFTSFLDVLDVELKIIALSETWIKPHHINYNLSNYNMEQNYRI